MTASLQLTGKIALVTGATRGIGWETAVALAEHGAFILLNGRDRTAAEERASEIRTRFGVESTALVFDAAEPAAIREAYKSIFSRYKRLDILVANAGIMQNGVIGMISDEAV